MLISELLQENSVSSINVTGRFEKELNKITSDEVYDDVIDFIRFKQKHPREFFNSKDIVGNRLLKNWNHCHIVFGKVIISYKSNSNELILAAITDHKSVEGSGPTILAFSKYLNELSSKDYIPFNIPSKTASSKEVDEDAIQNIFYLMATHPEDRDLLEKFSKGKDMTAIELASELSDGMFIDMDDLPLIDRLKNMAKIILQQTKPLLEKLLNSFKDNA